MKSNSELSIDCGSADDSFDTLKKACESEALKLCTSLIVKPGEVIEVPFWTSDFPELICVGKFTLSNEGSVKYELDFSQSTL